MNNGSAGIVWEAMGLWLVAVLAVDVQGYLGRAIQAVWIGRKVPSPAMTMTMPSDMIIVIAGLVYCSQSRTLGPRMGICGFHIAVGRLCRIRGNLTKGLLDRSLQPGDSVHARAVPVLRRCEQDGG